MTTIDADMWAVDTRVRSIETRIGFGVALIADRASEFGTWISVFWQAANALLFGADAKTAIVAQASIVVWAQLAYVELGFARTRQTIKAFEA